MSATAPTIHLMQRPGALAWRAIRQNPARSGLSALAVSFGVAMTIASNMIVGAFGQGMLKSDELRAMMEGLLSQLDPILNFVSVVIVAAAGFLVFNAFSMAITQRQRRIGMLRAVGMTRRQVMVQLLQEGLLIGGAGTVLGVLGGPPLGTLIVALVRRFSEGMFVFEDVPPAPFSVLLAIGLGLSISLLVTLLPARRAMRIPPLAALRQASLGTIEPVRPRTAWIGLGLLVALLAYLIIAPPGEWASAPWDTRAAILGCGLWLGGLWLLLRAAPDLVGRALRRPLARGFGAAGRLMADNLQRDRSRVTLTILTLAFGLLVLTGMSGFLKFFVGTIFTQTFQPGVEQDMMFVSRVDTVNGWSTIISLNLDSLLVSAAEFGRDPADGRGARRRDRRALRDRPGAVLAGRRLLLLHGRSGPAARLWRQHVHLRPGRLGLRAAPADRWLRGAGRAAGGDQERRGPGGHDHGPGGQWPRGLRRGRDRQLRSSTPASSAWPPRRTSRPIAP